jgi:hypothetical protein
VAVFPLQYVTKPNSPVAYNDRYATAPLGRKFAGQPKGVYVGFEPSVAGSILTLSPDPAHGYSLVKVPSQDDPSGMDIVLDTAITLNFVGQPALDFPVLVIARASYYNNDSQPTEASLITRSGPASSVTDDEVLVCIVDGPAGSISVVNDPALSEQDAPLALDDVNFGYMPGGSIENLQAAADVVSEIIAARSGLDSTSHASLSARLATDYGAASMAGRLALAFRTLRSNDYAMLTGATAAVVSGSFTEIDRDFLPEVTLSGDGAETVAGAVAGPSDTTRNVAMIVDATTGYRLIDNAIDRRTVYGRVTGPNESVVSGEWIFLNASTNLLTDDGNGQATVELAIGDTLQGPDDKHYEVATITDDNTVVLRTAYQGATATSLAVVRRRWQLLLKKIVAGAEQDASVAENTTVRFFFPAFLSMEESNADWKLALHTAAERAPLPLATTTAPGRVRLAASGGLLGSVVVQNVSVPLGGGPFHTINFNSVSASVLPTGTPGEVEIVQIGPPGAQGPDGPSGGPGVPGGPGPGFSQINPFELSPEFSGVTPGVPTPFSFTQDMGHNVRVIHGNIARFRDIGFFSGTGNDRLVITDVTSPTATEGRITGTIAGDTRVVLFLSSAGD